MSKSEIDTLNRHMVAVRGDHIVIMNPPRIPITNEDALVFAAWIVSCVGDDELWEETLKAVQNT